ncbi:YicC/YloC family endoribonuclease [Pseudidiomarina terrestris]|uniref:YicC/YloC family endoribonuclease n=1 Tax=Pseudidiomarina terrestris TaxID=2820060 RepID=UPI00264D240B|nr:MULTISPECIES: YicC/YloC family endoribonuclease [unclassified Pseudidiomarina]MDN7136535.1 YicC family protein [Pseudidiomarina sp. 1ASP75-5]MDN7138064.1 YicC family protein [Pseudidiomarina sp. 1ASP75-14]MEA3588166.1 YicC family protein [Pseudidiomarina sp. 1APP75-27a]
MIQSMTGYARHELKAEWGTATWELRSVNQRFLETYFRLPEQFRSMENMLREKLRKQLQRGKVECNLRLNIEQKVEGGLQLNEELAKSVISSANWVSNQSSSSYLNPLDVLRWPGVVAQSEDDVDAIQADVMAAFDTAVAEFIDNRASEGKALERLIEERLEGVSEQSAFVRKRMPEVLEWQRERLLTRLEDAKVELDPQRLESEMVMLAQKTDVAEELDRLDTHVVETRKILRKGGACGRRLDFMMQEFNREANTLGSKSINTDITTAAVELKVLIEQMREQIQNIE